MWMNRASTEDLYEEDKKVKKKKTQNLNLQINEQTSIEQFFNFIKV